MHPERYFLFPPFQVDTREGSLRRDSQEIVLRAKTFALLCYLLERPGRLVSKDELLDNVWAGISVAEGALTVCMTELRKALGDDAKNPRFIATVPKRGYRFIGTVVSSQHSGVSSQKSQPAPSLQPPASSSKSVASSFVGREQEMAELRKNLEDALSGRGRLVLLTGEPGIGKTRTAEELANDARLRNAQVLIGKCYEGEGAPPFWPWVQITRAYLSAHDDATMQAAMGAGAAAIAEVLPDVQARLPHLPTPPPLASEHARFRFFDSFISFLKHAATAHPLVLILDDLQWADTPSLLLFQFLARELSDTHIFLIGTYRDIEFGPTYPFAQALGELARIGGSQTLWLRGLAESEVAHFLTLTTTHAPSSTLITAIHQKTGGNPFFVTEVIHTLARDGEAAFLETGSVEQIPLPQRVRAAIERRLATLSAPCREMLAMAAAVGQEFALTLLDAVQTKSGVVSGASTLLALLNEAVAARFVAPTPRGVGRYSFAHALIRETLYASLGEDRRVRLHRQIGEALERMAGKDSGGAGASTPGELVAELAFHFFLAAPGGDNEKAIAYAIQAGERAATLFAYSEATTHYAHALQLMEMTKGAELQRGELLLHLGEAQRKAGSTTAAQETCRVVADLARSLRQRGEQGQSASLLARAALGFATGIGMVTATGGVEDPFIVGLLEEALAALGAEDSSLRACVLSRLALEIYYSRDPQRQTALSQEAVGVARRVDDTATLAYVLLARHIALGEPGNVEERLAAATEIMRLATAAGDKELALRGQLLHLCDLLELGDLRTADREFPLFRQRAEELRQPSYLWFVETWKAMRAWLRGRFAEANQLAREAFAIGRRMQDPDVMQCYTVQLFGLHTGIKSLQGIELPVQEFAERYTALPSWRSALVLLYATTGAKEDARREFEQFAANDFADIPRDGNWMITMTNFAQVCTILRDQPRAATLYHLLLPYAKHCVAVQPALLCLGSATRFLGLLALTLTRWSDAEAHFEEALQQNQQMGAKPLIALTQQQYAVMLFARRQPGDWERAMAFLNQALGAAQELGMDELENRLLAIKSRNEDKKPTMEKKETRSSNLRLAVHRRV
jgi:DNA-binding winged helix-turn-helix (wHTH) protein/tetratricopeptide (TPR) repeat protein